MEYGSVAEVYRKAFLDNYKTKYDMNVFYATEDFIHARYGIERLNYHIDTPIYENLKTILKESLEKCGLKVFNCLL